MEISSRRYICVPDFTNSSLSMMSVLRCAISFSHVSRETISLRAAHNHARLRHCSRTFHAPNFQLIQLQDLLTCSSLGAVGKRKTYVPFWTTLLSTQRSGISCC